MSARRPRPIGHRHLSMRRRTAAAAREAHDRPARARRIPAPPPPGLTAVRRRASPSASDFGPAAEPPPGQPSAAARPRAPPRASPSPPVPAADSPPATAPPHPAAGSPSSPERTAPVAAPRIRPSPTSPASSRASSDLLLAGAPRRNRPAIAGVGLDQIHPSHQPNVSPQPAPLRPGSTPSRFSRGYIFSKSLRFCVMYPRSSCHNFMCAAPFHAYDISKCSS
nr:vegetative cell wall protein gp1-like [Aegilops tauschii subsp. strangulata]